jgi:flagellar motility protein MotE (MotC chaperone)
VWSNVAEILKDPERLRAGLERMIEQERSGAHGDPGAQTEHWLEEISEANRKRSRYQEMAANELIDFDELRDRLAALEDTRKLAEEELRALQHRTERLEQLERDRDKLLESYAGLMPDAIDALGPEERHQVYRMIGMEAHVSSDGALDLSGDVINFSKVVISPS